MSAFAIYSVSYGQTITASDAPYCYPDFISWQTRTPTPTPTSTPVDWPTITPTPSPTLVPGTELADALDGPGLTWTTGGDADWLAQPYYYVEGTGAARSGVISPYQYSWIETTVRGPGLLEFWWSVDMELWEYVSRQGALEFAIDGDVVAEIRTHVEWHHRVFELGPGIHVLRWTFNHTFGTYSEECDAGWLDGVRFFPGYRFVPTPSPTPSPSLGQALDSPELPWESSGWDECGSVSWFGQTDESLTSGSAAQSGAISSNGLTYLFSRLREGGRLQFAWKVDCNEDNSLSFTIDLKPVALISGNVDWTERIYYLPSGSHGISWVYKKGYLGGGRDAGWVDAVRFQPGVTPEPTPILTPTPSLPIDVAVDQPGEPWTTGGDFGWFGEEDASYVNGNAARSGPVSAGQVTWIDRPTTGPAWVSFLWKVSSEPDADRLSFVVDGRTRASISGETDWVGHTEEIDPGPHHLRWSYAKDTYVDQGADAGWVDQVVIGPTPSWPTATPTPTPTLPPTPYPTDGGPTPNVLLCPNELTVHVGDEFTLSYTTDSWGNLVGCALDYDYELVVWTIIPDGYIGNTGLLLSTGPLTFVAKAAGIATVTVSPVGVNIYSPGSPDSTQITILPPRATETPSPTPLLPSGMIIRGE